MIRYIRDLRLIPIALMASACLLALKTADIVFHGSALFAGNRVAPHDVVAISRPLPDGTTPGSTASWAQQMFNFPDGSGAPLVPDQPPVVARLADRDLPDITGSVTTDAAGAAKVADAKPLPGKPGTPTATLIPTDGTTLPTGAERAILERLQQRREELDTRARELDIRESLIQGAEKRMDAKLGEIKEAEGRIKVETQQKNDAEVARLKGLVIMYESMKPRDAAKIFDGLDTPVLIEVASQINPRTMAEILAQMSPEVAQHLTVELASQAQQVKQGGPGDLPKIEGQPTAQ
jgi:flagellar motility protein MotE (MotC chaperone)